MKLKPYPAYKDSGVEWLGEVPKHWNLVSCRGFVKERTSKNDDGTNENYLSLMANIGIIPYAEKGDVGNKKPEDLTKCKLVCKGDFVINSMNYGIGSYGLSPYDGVCSPVYIVLKPRNEVVETGFATRVFENKAFQAYAQSFGNGILEHRAAINWDILKGISVGLPPIEEQSQILTFLDRETTKLDTLISKQEKLIELLQEKRQAVISHAVTKGLDPDAKMKDSGVAWLGMVPEHWQMTPMRFVSNLNPPVSFNEVNEDDELIFLPMDQIKNGFHLLNRAPLSNLNSSYNTFEKGDILLAKVTPCFENGNIAIAEGKGFGTSEIFVLRPTSIDSRLFYWYLQSDFFKMDGVASMTGAGGLKRVSSDVPQKHHIPKPPMNEQTTIANYIDQKTNKIDNLIEKTKRSIELAKEHRTALISAAVTGKIDVRDQVPEVSYA